jgi:hypothetical protein
MKQIYISIIFFSVTSIAFAQQAFNMSYEKQLGIIAAEGLVSVQPATRAWFAQTARVQNADSFNVAATKEKMQQKFTATQINEMGALFLVMLAYEKANAKQITVTDDDKMDFTKQLGILKQKLDKNAGDKKLINQQKQEALEKANKAMDAALIQGILGVASGASGAVGGRVVNTGIANGKAVGKDKKNVKSRNIFAEDQSLVLLSNQLAILKKSGL